MRDLAGAGGTDGLRRAGREIVYLLALLAYVGCHTDSHEQAHWFGDDIALRADGFLVDQTPRGQIELRDEPSRCGRRRLCQQGADDHRLHVLRAAEDVEG